MVKGIAEDLTILRVPIGLPKYRLANGRTASAQVEYVAMNPDLSPEFFSEDPELWKVQEAQHGLLLELADRGERGEVRRYFTDPKNKQLDPIVLDEHGFVVNGNRRLAVWRHLYDTDPDVYSHFAHVDVVVLPPCDEQEIDRIEAALQLAPDIKAVYSWDAIANMIIMKQKRDGLSFKELGSLYGYTEPKVREYLDMRDYADEYLRSRGRAERWSEVADMEFAFRVIVKNRQKLSGFGEKEVFKQAAFLLIEDQGTIPGRLYEVIPKIADHLVPLVERFSEDLDAGVLVGADSELDDLLGGGEQSEADVREMAVARAMQDQTQAEKARELIGEVLDSEAQNAREAKTARHLVVQVGRAHTALTTAAKDGLRPDSDLKGVLGHLDGIVKLVETIRAFVSKHAGD